MKFSIPKPTIILLALLPIVANLPSPSFGQDPTQIYITSDGLSIEFPETWHYEGILTEVSFRNTLNIGTTPVSGEIIGYLSSGEAFMRSGINDLNSATEVMPSVRFSALTLNNGNEALRGDVIADDLHHIIFFVNVNGRIVNIAITTLAAEFETHEAIIFSIIESMYYESEFVLPDLSAPAIEGEGILVWQQQFPAANMLLSLSGLPPFPDQIGPITSLVVRDGSVYISDGIVMAQIDSDGNIINTEDFGSRNNQLYRLVTIAPNGMIWAAYATSTFVGNDYDFIHLAEDGEPLNQWNMSDLDTEFVGDFYEPIAIQAHPNGNVYYLLNSSTEQQRALILLAWNSSGEFLFGQSLSEDPISIDGQDFVYNGGGLTITPEGNLLVVKATGEMMLLDTDANVLPSNFQNLNGAIEGVTGIVIAPNGQLYLTSTQGVHHLSADGTLIESFGTIQVMDDSQAEALSPLGMGEFSPLGPQGIDILSNGDVIVITTNYNHNVVMRLDFDRAE